MALEKHLRQINRQPKNMSKSIKLDVKKSCNRLIKEVLKNPKLSSNTKNSVISHYESIKTKFI